MIDRNKDHNHQAESPIEGMPWRVLILVVVLAVIFWLIMTRPAPELPSSHPAVGRPAPTLDLVQLIPGRPQPAEAGEQEPQDLITLSGLPPAGAVTLLHFWGTWCPPCKLEYPELVEMVREMEAEPEFRFVSVSCGGGGDEDYDSLQAQTADYYQSIEAGDLETFADLDGATRRVAGQQLSDSIVYPTTILISPDQRIAAVWLGYSPAGVSEMRQAATELLQQSL